LLPVNVPPRVKAGVVVPVYGLPDESVRKNEDVEADEKPVPPLATGTIPEISEVEIPALTQLEPLYLRN